MWHWAKDNRIRDAFRQFTIFELLILVITPIYWSLAPAKPLDGIWIWLHKILLVNVGMGAEAFWPIISWISIGILIAHRSIFSFKVHWPPGSFSNIHVFFWAMLIFFVILRIGMLFFLPESTASLAESLKSINSKMTFWKGIIGILTEEIGYRLILYYSLERMLGRNFSFWGTAVLFSLAHWYSIYYVIAVAPLAIILLLLVISTGSLIPAIIIHGIINLIALLAINLF